MSQFISEKTVREMPICPACGKPKDGGLMCWDCFKRGDYPFKTSGLDLDEWLRAINRIKKFRAGLHRGRYHFKYGVMSQNDIEKIERYILEGMTEREAIEMLEEHYHLMEDDYLM
ncbi:MAG: hypothetical protein D6822_00420 [Cyanobacteria bacterium J149]|nr:MAG: hypothetical protein D6822_00420 [Cyanobacteria bacterium J149]